MPNVLNQCTYLYPKKRILCRNRAEWRLKAELGGTIPTLCTTHYNEHKRTVDTSQYEKVEFLSCDCGKEAVARLTGSVKRYSLCLSCASGKDVEFKRTNRCPVLNEDGTLCTKWGCRVRVNNSDDKKLYCSAHGKGDAFRSVKKRRKTTSLIPSEQKRSESVLSQSSAGPSASQLASATTISIDQLEKIKDLVQDEISEATTLIAGIQESQLEMGRDILPMKIGISELRVDFRSNMSSFAPMKADIADIQKRLTEIADIQKQLTEINAKVDTLVKTLCK
jgi:hypothetical protein